MDNEETSPPKKTPELRNESIRLAKESKTSRINTTSNSTRSIRSTRGNSTSTLSTKKSNPQTDSSRSEDEMVFEMKQGTSESSSSPCPLEICKMRAGLVASDVSSTSSSTTTKSTPSPITESTSTKEPVTRSKLTFSTRPEEECSGGIVRWSEKCDSHNEKRPPWKMARWNKMNNKTLPHPIPPESRHSTPYPNSGLMPPHIGLPPPMAQSMPFPHPAPAAYPPPFPDPSVSAYPMSYSQPQMSSHQQMGQIPIPKGCECCDKRYCYRPGGFVYDKFTGQLVKVSTYRRKTSKEEIPFLVPPDCPENNQNGQQSYETPHRCQARYGTVTSKYKQQNNLKVTNHFGQIPEYVSHGLLNPHLQSAGTNNISNISRNSNNVNSKANLMSHISGFESQLTVPSSINYIGYSQKYPQNVLKFANSKRDSNCSFQN